MPTPDAGSFNLAWHCLGRQAARRGGKTALIIADGPDAQRAWTFAELDAKVRRLAGGFLASGLRKGDRVMIRAANDIEAVIAIFATAAIGCVAQPASLMLTAEEALALAADSGASAIVLGDADPHEQALFHPLRVFDREAIRRLAAESAPADYAPTAPDDPAYLVYTSGSTAEPKGVLHGHRVVIGRRPMADDWLGLGETDVVLHAGNLNWT
jgi:acyl-coenzyme A synthetase/AMP-(fatty) acid ligase